MAIAVGTAGNMVGNTGGTSRTITLPGAVANDIVVLGCMQNSTLVNTISGPNIGSFSKFGHASPSNPVELWWARATGTLTNEVCTLNYVGTSAYSNACVVNVAGLYQTGSPLDTNVNALQTGSGGNGQITFDDPDCIAFGAFRSASSATTTPDTANGWTGLDANSYLMLEYKIFNSAQTNLVVPNMTNTSNNGRVCAALRKHSAGATGQIKVHNGTTFVPKPVKYWNGSSWVTKPLKYWDGSSWITTPY